MRYALVRFKGEPTHERPVGMNDIMGLSRYQSLKNAYRYLWTVTFNDSTGRDLIKVLAEKGYTHFGLYEVPEDYREKDKLVKIITNPYSYLYKETDQ